MRPRVFSTAVTCAGAIALSAFLLVAPAPPAQAQTFNEAIKRALDGNCAGLKGSAASSYDGSLADICAIPPTSSGASSGAGITLLTTHQATAGERRVRERLGEARPAPATGGRRGAPA